ncbi:coenzyme F430 synthase [Methanohalophilus mahii]|uniref:Mur ligase middle domain protein n=1 Tax=Methanohalophilus mahii (strain ATCC 35705 / DSM 5219 / SLP) TaxID=547558 RepID=D5E6X1_METMS|nr:coenzyme F430 synthase [Methanohalophilus mahii]ADE36909.1 Mur ligase middle domain protein [Methanohalophilus mahii DSM 5219]
MTAGQRHFIVLDLNHGGLLISSKLAGHGYRVTAVDVYGTLPKEAFSDLPAGIEVVSKPPLPAKNAIIVTPVHLDPAYPVLEKARTQGNTIYSHHAITGQILREEGIFDQAKVIEITGVKAKTSTVTLLARILALKEKVILHTTRGIEYLSENQHIMLHKGLSITPASILEVINIVKGQEIDPSVYVLEESLGTTGIGEIGIFTTLTPDYRIASNSKWASEAKMQIMSHLVVIMNHQDTRLIENNRNTEIITFASDNQKADLISRISGENISIISDGKTIECKLQHGYNPEEYAIAFAASACAGLQAGADPDDIRKTFEEFRGIEGRMRLTKFRQRRLIDNSSSGLNIDSARSAIEMGLDKSAKNVLIIGEHAAQVCEGFPPQNVQILLSEYKQFLDHVILIGKRMENLSSQNIIHRKNLQEGLECALSLTDSGDTIISCVKCFR